MQTEVLSFEQILELAKTNENEACRVLKGIKLSMSDVEQIRGITKKYWEADFPITKEEMKQMYFAAKSLLEHPSIGDKDSEDYALIEILTGSDFFYEIYPD